MSPPPARWPNLAQRAFELRQFGLPGTVTIHAGRLLEYRYRVHASEFGREYECLLRLTPDARGPEVFVLAPCLVQLAGGVRPPHTYRHDGPGTKLCLWWPKTRDWTPQLKLTETFIPWTSRWLFTFEDWLFSGEWSAGGAHPPDREERRRRGSRRATTHD